MEWIVETNGLSVERADVRILEDITLAIGPSEVVGVAGPNGSGKTTLLRALATLTPISSGELRLFGEDQPALCRKRVGMIGHRPYLVPQLTLAENLHHFGRLSDLDPVRVNRSIEVVGLSKAANRRAEDASFGMLRRIEIASQLLAKPDLLLLDEAGSGLDEPAQMLISELVRLTTGRGGAVVVVSHGREYLNAICDRVLDLVGGKLGSSE